MYVCIVRIYRGSSSSSVRGSSSSSEGRDLMDMIDKDGSMPTIS